MYDSKHGKDRLYKHGHNDPGGRFKKGLVPHNYKGKTIERGYVRIAGYYNHPRNHDGRVFEHILVMEKLLGRYIDETEVVHHKNGDRRDNKPENLEIMIRGQHQRYHNHLRYHK